MGKESHSSHWPPLKFRTTGCTALESEPAMANLPLVFTYYVAAPIDKVWDGFISKETNQKIFMGADFEADLKTGGLMTWSGPGKDGKPMRYVTGRIVKAEAPRLLEYEFGM